MKRKSDRINPFRLIGYENLVQVPARQRASFRINRGRCIPGGTSRKKAPGRERELSEDGILFRVNEVGQVNFKLFSSDVIVLLTVDLFLNEIFSIKVQPIMKWDICYNYRTVRFISAFELNISNLVSRRGRWSSVNSDTEILFSPPLTIYIPL